MKKLVGQEKGILRRAYNGLTHYKPFRILKQLPFLLSLFAFVTVVYDYGFDQAFTLQNAINEAYIVALILEVLFLIVRYCSFRTRPKQKVWSFDFLLFLTVSVTVPAILAWYDLPVFTTHYWIAFVFLMIFLRELSIKKIEFKRRFINPAQLFLLSFFIVIIAGTFVLMFPNATHNEISFIDALFTSTSAVCVTGLSVVDTGACFTPMGQMAILILIQLGGLGIMTFTSYFSYYFTGESSYENQLVIQEMTNSDKITDVFKALKKVLLLTFVIEGIGVVLLYSNLNFSLFPGFKDRLFFSVFHSVSAFCNAGFSTLSLNFYDPAYRFNYPILLIISGLIIFGGIGFPILFNFFNYVRHLFIDRLFKKQRVHVPWVININTRIVVVTTTLLLVLGTALFYVFEYDNTLAEHGTFGKIVTAFFGAVIPRTAGFNSVDNNLLHTSTVLLLYFLMWVGASPGSTGGGIKTSTLAISIMNSISIARGKDRIELYGREISDSSVRRAYSQIFLSLLAIGLSVFFVSWFDQGMSLRSIIFECISAFSTVGSSLGITTFLSDASKLVLVITMFVGRISMLTLLGAIFKQVKFLKYKYPSDDILIN